MSNLAIWWLGDAYPPGSGWPIVVRGKRGICYSLPARPNGWLVRMRWEDGECPTSDPLPDEASRVIGWRLGLPGLTEPSPREWAMYGEWSRCEAVWLMGLDAEARADDAEHGALRCYLPGYDPEHRVVVVGLEVVR